MFTAPKMETRDAQHYVGLRTLAAMHEFKTVIPQSLGEVFGWLDKNGIAPAGLPFIRFHVIDMKRGMDIEMGVPVAIAVTNTGENRIAPGVFPSGRYASLVYTGIENGIEANKQLLDWGAAQGLAWDTYVSDKGDGFGARYETFLTDPDDEPDPAQWKTEVAIRIADASASSSSDSRA